MEIEVMLPTVSVDFNFDSVCTTPYISAPSSPQGFGTFFFSAPTSPTRTSAFYNEFNSFRGHHKANDSLSTIPFDWEEKPGIPKTKDNLGNVSDDDDDNDFAFDFSGQLETSSLTADELFDGGKIKPLKPPPRLQYDGKLPAESSSPRSPRSPKKMFKEAFSPRHRKKDFDPFAAALEQTRREYVSTTNVQEPPNDRQERGRERTCDASPTARKKGGRSLSPFRVSDLLLDREHNLEDGKHDDDSSSSSLFSTSSFASFWYRKWKLKDLLLFRSASEGHATSKEQLKKYAMLKKTQPEDMKNSSFRSTGSVSSVSSSKRRGRVSAHELHYTANRAMAEEMRKKTSLPYKPGVFGCLGFNPGVPIPEISRSFGSMSRESC